MAKTPGEHINIAYQVTFNAIDIGLTDLDGIKVKPERNDIKKTFDQYGKSLVGMLSGGENLIVSLKLAQWNTANWKIAVPQAIRYTSSSGTKITIGRIPGRDFANDAKLLTLHRFPDASTVKTYDIKLYKCVCVEIGDVENSSQKGFLLPITFQAFVDTTRANGRLLGEIGVAGASASTPSTSS